MNVEKMYSLACEQYAEHGVDVELALKTLDSTPISIHAWQGDDVVGFENKQKTLTGGCQVTGNYPGVARTSEELRSDLDLGMTLIPGPHRVCLQGHEVDVMLPGQDRDSFTMENFAGWLAWAKEHKYGMDIAPCFYSHPKLDYGLSLSHPDPEIRKFWINHGKAIRRIGAQFGRELGTPCVCNFWMPDGFKDTPADRMSPRIRLRDSLDECFAEAFPKTELLDAVEAKLFGIGVESCTIGSYDFYATYAAKRNLMLCLDMGHYHPTESIPDKLSSIVCNGLQILLHVSRGVRWDSDHVIVLNDDLSALGQEIAVHNLFKDVFLCLDYFDATINRIAAWVIGARNMQKSLLCGLLLPKTRTFASEAAGDFTTRLALQEAAKTLPWNAVWNYYCESRSVLPDYDILTPIRADEEKIRAERA